jgi:zinc/manganese transport system substrate-binding protein
MKTILTILILIWSAVVLFASEPIEVVTTLPDFKNFVEVIGGNVVHVTSIANGNQDPHHVEIKPSDIIKVKKADLLIINGLDLDPWIYPLIANSRNSKIQKGAEGYVDASDGIMVLEIPTTKIDRSQGDGHPYGNPHYTLSPTAMRSAFKNILKAMIHNFPEHQKLFEKNGQTYLAMMDNKIIEWKSILKKLPNKKIVSYHNSWAYFFNDFGLESGGYMEPKPGIMPSPAHTAELIARMKNEKTQIILKETYFSDSTPRFIAEKTGATVLEVPTSTGGNSQAQDYLALIDYLVQIIAKN